MKSDVGGSGTGRRQLGASRGVLGALALAHGEQLSWRVLWVNASTEKQSSPSRLLEGPGVGIVDRGSSGRGRVGVRGWYGLTQRPGV